MGDYEGELDNDGERWCCRTSAGAGGRGHLRRPLPLAGGRRRAGRGRALVVPEKLGNRGLDDHRFLGRSLERLNADQPGTLVANWAASPLDGATPGRANTRSASRLSAVAAIEVARRHARPGQHPRRGHARGARALRRRPGRRPADRIFRRRSRAHRRAASPRSRWSTAPMGFTPPPCRRRRSTPSSATGCGAIAATAPRCCPRSPAIPATGTPTSSAPRSRARPRPTTCSSARRTGN